MHLKCSNKFQKETYKRKHFEKLFRIEATIEVREKRPRLERDAQQEKSEFEKITYGVQKKHGI